MFHDLAKPMTPHSVRTACAVLAVSSAALAGCPDSVAPDYYEDPDALPTGDASSATLEAMGWDGARGSTEASTGDGPDPEGATSGDASGSHAPSGPCDLTGRWLVTVRTVTDALGTSQAAHEWYYYDITQSGSDVTVSKGLACGENVRALSAASGNADFPKTWPAMMTKLVVTGRKGTSSSTSGGCEVSFPTYYEVMSATEAYYTNPSETLPSVSQEATGSTPGWEDWDEDGEPGYTMSITGIATGQIYMVARTRFALSGTIAASASTFDLAVDWDSEQDVLGVNGPPILSMTASAVKDGNPAMHFATFARLSASQATGSDADVCSAIRSLAPMLASDANN